MKGRAKLLYAKWVDIWKNLKGLDITTTVNLEQAVK